MPTSSNSFDRQERESPLEESSHWLALAGVMPSPFCQWEGTGGSRRHSPELVEILRHNSQPFLFGQ